MGEVRRGHGLNSPKGRFYGLAPREGPLDRFRRVSATSHRAKLMVKARVTPPTAAFMLTQTFGQFHDQAARVCECPAGTIHCYGSCQGHPPSEARGTTAELDAGPGGRCRRSAWPLGSKPRHLTVDVVDDGRAYVVLPLGEVCLGRRGWSGRVKEWMTAFLEEMPSLAVQAQIGRKIFAKASRPRKVNDIRDLDALSSPSHTATSWPPTRRRRRHLTPVVSRPLPGRWWWLDPKSSSKRSRP